MCSRCTLAGPQVPPERVRYLVRAVDGGIRGPLSYDAITDQLLRGAVVASDRVARQGGTWAPIVEHPDLQSFFLPGTADAERLEAASTQKRRDQVAGDARKVGRIALAGLFAAAGIGLAVAATTLDLFVVPEATVQTVSAFFGQSTEAMKTTVVNAVDPGAAAEEVERSRVLPGDEVLAELKEAWPTASGSAHLRLHRGRADLWTGRDADLKSATEHLEQAALLSPTDVEAWGSLAELYARRLTNEPSLSERLAVVVERVEALDGDSPAAQRAAAAAALANGAKGRAADLAGRCASNPGSAGLESSTADLGCAIIAAEAQDSVADLAQLRERFSGLMPVELAYARALLAQDRFRESVEVASALSRSMPDEPEPLVVLLKAHRALGEFEDARKAGRELERVVPDRVELLALTAEIDLKVFGRARSALEAYLRVVGHERAALLETPGRVYVDAASAAIAAGQLDRAVELADAALKIDERDPVAGLQKARALQRLDKVQDAEALLRATDPIGLNGHDLARFHVEAARIYVDAGRERLAETELRSASETDSHWARVPLEAARNRLAVGDDEGAVVFLEQAAFMDLYVDEARDPLQRVWTDSVDWKTFRRDLQTRLLGDARFTSRGHAAIGVVALYAGMTDARRSLERSLAGGTTTPAAFAGLAQHHLHRGDTGAAIEAVSRVVDTSSQPGVLYGVRGLAMARRGEAAQSRAAFVQALEKAPTEPTLYRWRALAQLEASDRRGAKKSLAEALRLMPDDLAAKVALVDLRDQLDTP